MKTVLVSGANRGIGLEFCRQYLQSGWSVLAACRAPESATELEQLSSQYPAQLQIKQLDVADENSIARLKNDLSGQAIDVLINNAGVYGDSPGRGFGNLDYQQWLSVLTVNTLAPVHLTESLIENVERGSDKLVVAITSKMGSIDDNGSGGSILYRSSKAALNAAMKSLSINLAGRGIGVLIMHPGWVVTDMGGPNGLINTQQSVSGMMQQFEQFKLANSGCFIDYAGKVIPW